MAFVMGRAIGFLLGGSWRRLDLDWVTRIGWDGMDLIGPGWSEGVGSWVLSDGFLVAGVDVVIFGSGDLVALIPWVLLDVKVFIFFPSTIISFCHYITPQGRSSLRLQLHGSRMFLEDDLQTTSDFRLSVQSPIECITPLHRSRQCSPCSYRS